MRTLWFGVVGLPATAFFSFVSLVGGLVGAPRGLHDWVHRGWSRTLLRTAGVRVRVSGRENLSREGAQIFIANHQSMFDVFALMATAPVSLRFVAKREIGRVPLLAQAMRAAGHVFIDRKDRIAAIAAMRAAGERMKREPLTLVLFPEGTRSPDGRLLPFKKGTFVLAIETQAALVPVALEGGGRVLEKGSWRVHAGRMDVRFGKPIPTRGRTSADREELLECARKRISALLAEIRRDAGAPPTFPGSE